jgi:hypothetical protein
LLCMVLPAVLSLLPVQVMVRMGLPLDWNISSSMLGQGHSHDRSPTALGGLSPVFRSMPALSNPFRTFARGASWRWRMSRSLGAGRPVRRDRCRLVERRPLAVLVDDHNNPEPDGAGADIVCLVSACPGRSQEQTPPTLPVVFSWSSASRP